MFLGIEHESRTWGRSFSRWRRKRFQLVCRLLAWFSLLTIMKREKSCICAWAAANLSPRFTKNRELDWKRRYRPSWTSFDPQEGFTFIFTLVHLRFVSERKEEAVREWFSLFERVRHAFSEWYTFYFSFFWSRFSRAWWVGGDYTTFAHSKAVFAPHRKISPISDNVASRRSGKAEVTLVLLITFAWSHLVTRFGHRL